LGQSNLRIGRYSQHERIYSITFTTFHRQQVLDFYVGRVFVKTLHQSKILKDHKLLCWIVMPDHVHILLSLGANESLSIFIQRLKSESSKAIKRKIQMDSPVWAKGFFDRALRREDDVTSMARYIVANPIRAGLIKSVRYYSLWDAVWL